MLPRYEISLKQSLAGCQVRSSPVLEEALSLGFVIRSIKPSPGIRSAFSFSPLDFVPGAVGSISPSRVRLPQGHRFYSDCHREQVARFIEWGIRTFSGDCWFFTLTFKDYISFNRAMSFHDRFLARLKQAYMSIPGAELLRSITSVEWQQREVIHYHLLIFGRQLRQLSRKRWERRWQITSGGFCANYNAEIKAAPYLAKHSIKGRLDSNLYFGGAWRGIVPPRSVSRCCSKAISVAHSKRQYSDNLGIAACNANAREFREVAV
jgi:hypothetical protein